MVARFLIPLVFLTSLALESALAAEATLSGRVCVIDDDSIMLGGKRNRNGRCAGGIDSRLGGVAAPEWDETCQGQDGRWPCGRTVTAPPAKRG